MTKSNSFLKELLFSHQEMGSFPPWLNPDFLKPLYSKYSVTSSMSLTWIRGSKAESRIPEWPKVLEWPKYWSFSFSISPSNEHPGLISLRMDWLDLLAVRGTLKSLLQHHSSKASILRCTAFFTVQLTSILDHWKNYSLD